MIKRKYTVAELKQVDNTVRNYTVDFCYLGTKGTYKVHVGLKGNHYDVIETLTKKAYGDFILILGARVTGKEWAEVSPFERG